MTNTTNTPTGPPTSNTGAVPSAGSAADLGWNMLDEATIVSRTQDGDLAAFQALVERYQSRLHRLAVRTLNDRAAAQEVMAQTLISVWRSLPDLDDPAAFKIWLYRLTTLRCLDRLRRRRSEASPDEPATVSHGSVVPGSGPPVDSAITAETGEIRPGLNQALADLPVDLRICWLLKEVDQLGYPEIAQVLSLSDRIVRARLGRARHVLAEAGVPTATTAASNATAGEFSGRLACGHSVEDVWESRSRPPDLHERSCASCRDARARLLLLDQSTRDLNAEDGVDPNLQVDPAATESIMVVARAEPRPDRLLPMVRPGRAETDSTVLVGEHAICDQVRALADTLPGVRARRCAAGVSTSTVADREEVDQRAVLDIMITVAVSRMTRIPPAVAELRRQIIDRLASRTGLTIGAVNIAVEDIYDA